MAVPAYAGQERQFEEFDTSTMSVQSGPVAGLLGDIAALYDRSYSQYWNFPIFFKAKVAHWMGDF